MDFSFVMRIKVNKTKASCPEMVYISLPLLFLLSYVYLKEVLNKKEARIISCKSLWLNFAYTNCLVIKLGLRALFKNLGSCSVSSVGYPSQILDSGNSV